MKNYGKYILPALVALGFFIYGLYWEFFIHTPYHWYIKDFENVHDKSLGYNYEQQIDGFFCRANIPLFGDNGFLCIRTAESITRVDENGNIIPSTTPDICIWIWPSVFEEPKYMIDIEYLINDRTGSTSDASYIKYEKKADGTYEIEHELTDPVALEIFNENRDMIEDMLDCIAEIWSFNGYEDIKKGLECKYDN